MGQKSHAAAQLLQLTHWISQLVKLFPDANRMFRQPRSGFIRSFRCAFRQLQRGFNLIEAAIVLGVVGLVIGGIWVAASAVMAKQRQSETTRGVLQAIEAVRKSWPAGASPGAAGSTPGLGNYNAYAISAGIFPSNWVSGSTIHDPWGKPIMFDYGATGWGGAYANLWVLELSNVDQADCYNIVPALIEGMGRANSIQSIWVGEVGDTYSGISSPDCSYYNPTKIMIFLNN